MIKDDDKVIINTLEYRINAKKDGRYFFEPNVDPSDCRGTTCKKCAYNRHGDTCWRVFYSEEQLDQWLKENATDKEEK